MDKKKVDRAIKVAIAGTAVATAATAAALTGTENIGLIKLTPEAFKVLDDGRKFATLMKKSGRTKPNPLWLEEKLFTGTDSDPFSPCTIDYLKARRYKKIGSSVFGMAGVASSSHSAGVNAFGIAKESNALATTGLHCAKLGSIGMEHVGVAEVQRWIDTIRSIKGSKMLIRGIKLAGASAPFMSMPASIAAEFAKLGVEMTTEALCDTLGAEIHYSAYVERTQKHIGDRGPANQIVRELFTKRGATRIFGSYDPLSYIEEPGGWKAIADKIALI